jgi:putative ABC transport system permease protein
MLIDLRHLFRSLRRSPATAATAILTLGLTLGIGASIFAIVDAVILTPLPFANPEALVVAGETPVDEESAAPRTVSYATFEAWRERTSSMAALAALDGTNLTLTGIGAAERIRTRDVTPNFLALLGVSPILGRTFGPEDVGRSSALISSAFWHGKLAGDAGVIGRRLVLGGREHTIVGVLDDSVSRTFDRGDVWRQLPVPRDEATRSGYRVRVLARLAPDVTLSNFEAALDDVSRTAAPPARATVARLAATLAGDRANTLGLLAVAASLAILIAFTNLAGLSVVRLIDRRSELVLRNALGADRFAAVKQLLLEAGVLVAAGTLAGLLLALWVTPSAGRLALGQIGALADRNITVGWRVVGVLALVGFACAVVCGLLPALATTKAQMVDVLRREVTPSSREHALRRAFVAAQVAVAFVLLVSMSLLGQALFRVTAINPGVDARGVLTLQLSLPSTVYTPERVASSYSTLHGALQERLGQRTVSIVDELPLTGDGGRRLVSAGQSGRRPEAVVRAASPGYFDVMRIPIVSGRPLGPEDHSTAPLRVVITTSLAARLFGSDSPLGRQIRVGVNGQDAEVIGVAGDVKHRALDEATLPTVYLSALQAPSPSSIIVIRSPLPDADVMAVVREEVARVDRDLPVYGVRRMEDVVAASPGVPARRLVAAAFTAFALLAVVLSAIGLFGVAAHEVARRRAEFALRIAVGANPMRILRSTLARGTSMVAAGLAAGGVLSIAALRAFGGVIDSSGYPDALSVGLAAVVLVATGAGAVLPAALRAARTDPAIALRGD